jgi:hypothetical protein
MPFAYFKRLQPKQKKIYAQSDAVSFLRLPPTEILGPVLSQMEEALKLGHRERTEEKVRQFASYLCELLRTTKVRVKVLERRPSNRGGELHGLYEYEAGGTLPLITVWMRTAKRIQPVAWRTFFRTVLHELLHHLDYHFFKFEDSFHTEGFYKRESSLIDQLLGKGE